MPRPDVRRLLDYVNAAGPTELDIEIVRKSQDAAVEQADLPMGDLATVRDLEMPGGIRARLFDPRESREPGPVVLWLHGGGFVWGGVESHQSLCAQAARELDLPVVLVEYRLAPEAKFPAAQDDAETAARWLAGNPAELGREVRSLVLAGDSAGGLLTIVTAMALRDRPAAVGVDAHLVIYPVADESREYPSEREFAEGYLLTAAQRRWFREQYQPVPDDVRASPLLGDLTGLPPAVVMTAELDPVRDHGRAYAAALVSAGVPTVFQEAKGIVHAFVLMRGAVPSARADVSAALAALRGVTGTAA
ncbi:acetyl esterase [Amycolatopsis bartoniae]|uniref:Acetylhydrolase n=1 Tax=Amycolatopsis bartoniae TaxID=941986 RepID=A0A8H9J3D1_9PSEU|nr:alpha/beta hydrolase [Amycolatopsis bartoniae]MBB2933756.1 acetyl esterase [Amycolatopsis bartoniae]GHF71926.1 acetylhydrolase [Amycolatopsis bartoniae]